MDKETIRSQMMKTLQQQTIEEKRNRENQLFVSLTESTLWKNANIIGITISGDIEWNTKPIIEYAWKQQKTVVVPKCIPSKKELIFYEIDAFNQLTKGYANLQEPDPLKTIKINKKSIDLLIVPGIAFDERGYRIGFGGGYYDRFLQDFDVLTASLVSDLQIKHKIPNDKYDIPVNYLITEKNIIKTIHS